MRAAKSLFKTKTFQGATLSLVIGLASVLIPCAYGRYWPTEKDALAIIALFGTFGWTLIGRSQTSPIYTPSYLPGPNRSDFEVAESERL